MTELTNPSGPSFTPGMREFLDGLIARATFADRQPPFSDQSLIDLESGVRQLVVLAAREKPAAAAIVLFATDSFDAEFVVDPLERHHGLGNRMMIEMLREAHGTVRIWAHGDHPDARRLAKRYDFEPVRELLQLRAEVSTGSTSGRGTATIDTFRPGVDDAEWLAVNARAFATHPEQGSLTQADLDARKSEDWFDADDFLVARADSGEMMGFCWLKVEEQAGEAEQIGEFYAVGVHPKYQGLGLGRQLVSAGLARLAERGIRTASLYVEADNVAAVNLYRSFGFADHSIDIQYELKRR
ncbi:mycothiol synthase [Parafrigoribacterium humi]|uniref:mycothiol synthase n=1 Tax=Parafrigoribacterium humi TaxID=3144664 RepID=UPI0032EDCCE9